MRRQALTVVTLAAAFLLQVGAGAPAQAASGDLTRTSTSDSGVWGYGRTIGTTVSPGGTIVAFDSSSTDLGEGDIDPLHDIYLKDLTTGALTLASTSDTGVKANGHSFRPTLSTDGTRVAFDSHATNFGEGDTDTGYDIYVKDLTTGALTLASTSDDGTSGNGSIQEPSFSADATRAAFISSSTNLGEGDTDSLHDVYVKDLTTGDLTLASTSDSGIKANRDSIGGSALSADGTRVAFASLATNLGEGITNGSMGIYVKDLTTGALTLASTSRTGTVANAGNYGPSLSADGTRVAFLTDASNLNDGDTNFTTDVYVKDLTTGAIQLASTDGGETTGASSVPALMADGTRVAFATGTSAYLKELPGSSAPVATDDAYATSTGSILTVPAPGVLANDRDADLGDSLRASLVIGPSQGSVTLAADGGFSYTPVAGYQGPDGFAYRGNDGSNRSSLAWVTISVDPVNVAPVASAGDDQTVGHNTAFTLSGSGTDADGDSLVHSWTQVSGTVAVIRDPDEAETVVEGVQGRATLVFRHTVTDPSGATSSDDVTITVNPK